MTTESHADMVARLRRLWPEMADRAERTRLAILEDARRGENWSEEEEEEDNMDAEERTTLDRLVEELEDRQMALRLWALAVGSVTQLRKSSPSSGAFEAGRAAGVLDAISVLTGDDPHIIAGDLGALLMLTERGAFLGAFL